MCNPFEDNLFFLWQLFRIFSFPLVFCKTTVVALWWILVWNLFYFFSLSFTRLSSILESSHLQSLQILSFVSCFLYSPFQSPIKYVLNVFILSFRTFHIFQLFDFLGCILKEFLWPPFQLSNSLQLSKLISNLLVFKYHYWGFFPISRHPFLQLLFIPYFSDSKTYNFLHFGIFEIKMHLTIAVRKAAVIFVTLCKPGNRCSWWCPFARFMCTAGTPTCWDYLLFKMSSKYYTKLISKMKLLCTKTGMKTEQQGIIWH